MKRGRVYLWHPHPGKPNSGSISLDLVPLHHLEPGETGLQGRYVRVRNAGVLNESDPVTGEVQSMSIGNAQPNGDGDFLFHPCGGGTRVDKVTVAEPEQRAAYIEASHFGEVNTYYHLDRIAAYIDELLHELKAPSLPPVTAVVNAHHAAVEIEHGIRDGVRRGWRWVPFPGGHYRQPGPSYRIYEHDPIEPAGEIHLGPGWRLLRHGALVEFHGGPYRSNASHNAPIIYHEYGHHLTRHTADFRANNLSRPTRQNNVKIAMDEGSCDYWAAVMLSTPHIWAWHRRHDDEEVHQRSLTSTMTMADYDHGAEADAHLNGTIWAASLWDLRAQVEPRQADKLVLQGLLLLGQRTGDTLPPTVKSVRRARESFEAGLAALLEADELLYESKYRATILETFAARGVHPQTAIGDSQAVIPETNEDIEGEDVPASEDLFTPEDLEEYCLAQAEPPFSLIAVGDTMLAGRTTAFITQHGIDYPFEAVQPLLNRAAVVLGNLEGPLAREAQKVHRNYSYRVNPRLATALKDAGFNVLTLANNHVLDCGDNGLIETMGVLDSAGIAHVGAGANDQAAHEPVILCAAEYKVGILSYCWTRRAAARSRIPGTALDSAEAIEADIGALRSRVDRIVVTFHWGVPYEREPLPEDRKKAQLAVACGADVVMGHHPHIVQPFEIHRGRPIFYSIGNFAFGSGNSKGEGLMLGIRFTGEEMSVFVYPLYVRNRDPRVNYQPKLLGGEGAARVLQRLADVSGADGKMLKIEEARAVLTLPYRPLSTAAREEYSCHR